VKVNVTIKLELTIREKVAKFKGIDKDRIKDKCVREILDSINKTDSDYLDVQFDDCFYEKVTEQRVPAPGKIVKEHCKGE